MSIQLVFYLGEDKDSPEIVKLGPAQLWFIYIINQHPERGKMIFRDAGSRKRESLEETYAFFNKNSRWVPHNTRRIIGALERKGLVVVRDLPCPNHPNHKKKFVFITPKGREVGEMYLENNYFSSSSSTEDEDIDEE